MYYLLFTTPHCPKCPAFKTLVQDQTKIKGEVLDPDSPDFPFYVNQFGLSQAPTLLVFTKSDNLVLETSELAVAQDFFNQF